MEQTILRNLLYNDAFVAKVSPYLKPEYFDDAVNKLIYKLIDRHLTKYSAKPSIESLQVDLTKVKKISDEQAEAVFEEISLLTNEPVDLAWLLENAEALCQDRAIRNALSESILIADDQGEQGMSRGSIPQIMTDALAISFDPNIGHDYLEDYAERYDSYTIDAIKYPFNLKWLNDITNNGFEPDTLNVFLAGTGVGKTMLMAHDAAFKLLSGVDALYVTFEIGEFKIAHRVDANLMGVDLDDILEMPKEVYKRKMDKIQNKAKGKLVVREYPPTSINCSHLRHLLSELKLKKSFMPKVVYIDYINLMSSVRHKNNHGVGSYTIVKAVAEELRALAKEFNLCIITATQSNREGQDANTLNLDNVAESFGLPQTSDFFCAVISNEGLDELNQMLFKQLKNRYSDKRKNTSQTIGIDTAKQLFYDVDKEYENIGAKMGGDGSMPKAPSEKRFEDFNA